MTPCRRELYHAVGLYKGALFIDYIGYIFSGEYISKELVSRIYTLEYSKGIMILFHYSKKFQEIKEKQCKK